MTTSSALLKIRHVTGFHYDGCAQSSYNEVRMTPPTLARQRVVHASIRVLPAAVQSTYRDYFDTIVTTFDLHESHEQLEVIAEATVETYAPPLTSGELTLGELGGRRVSDTFAEYLAPTQRTKLASEVLVEVRSELHNTDDVVSIAHAAVDLVRRRVAYVRGATLVSSTAQDVWDQRKGVCQDLSHVTIAVLRSLGIPARYVSGYLLAREDAGVGETVYGESHAWVEFFDGAWQGIDPTQGDVISLLHVVVAKGREYGDVAPLKGVYHGDPSSALGVVVEMTRVA